MSRKQRLYECLEKAHPEHVLLRIEDESQQHSRGQETHFNIMLVSDSFAGVARLQRHKMIYSLLQDEMRQGLHALTLQLLTEAEWKEQGGGIDVRPSPPCHGGEKREEKAQP